MGKGQSKQTFEENQSRVDGGIGIECANEMEESIRDVKAEGKNICMFIFHIQQYEMDFSEKKQGVLYKTLGVASPSLAKAKL